MTTRKDARAVTINLYGKPGSIFGQVMFAARLDQTGMCRLSFMREDVCVYSLSPNLGIPLGDSIQYLHDVERVKFQDMADALERWREYTPRWDVLPRAAHEFWSCLLPDILLELTAQYNTITVGGWNLANEVKLSLDAITGVEISCRSEALSFALAMGYRKMVKENFPKAIDQEPDLLHVPFNSGNAIIFSSKSP